MWAQRANLFRCFVSSRASVTYPFITKESQKTWESLKKSNYDWSHQAMDHWSERVKGKCKTNNSYAIAHGLT